jgi:hypothetical protein
MKHIIFYITVILLLFISCNKDGVSTPLKAERTIIVYIAADNNLWDVAYVDLEETVLSWVHVKSGQSIFAEMMRQFETH